ncbi:putative pectinesterase 29 [Cinnamomum micranthum f. kanehirae]|uniref:Pectinesterase n=1 Tax=Cinnamomum micranthum f. kanehirae TaxID=337451 RepID=A0A3S3Q0M5_9MAGN|nr:putative pectinesterase 29 [Cinnamomum micranthum f. kanehirae]
MRFCGSFIIFICILVIFCCGFWGVEGSRWTYVAQSAPIGRTIIVDQSGNGDYTKIQPAINSVPSGNTEWIRIIVRPGTYREKVTITPDKPYIILEGQNRSTTIISGESAGDIVQSATFSTFADNFIAKWIAFENTYNYKNTRTEIKKAVAALIAGDKSAFYHCGFYGVQDTLWDCSGRHFFYDCRIQGAVDFIFGAGQSLYEESYIIVEAEGILGPGYVTAQGRENPNDESGFVFKSCYLRGNGKVYLGRAWRPYSRVLFYDSDLSNVVVPEGWDAWEYNSSVATISFSEHACRGEGSDMSRRVAWQKKLNDSELTELTSLSFIDRGTWLQQQP